MTAGDTRLDGRTHEQLVAEARHYLQYACPELNINGGPDPGATLVELFAWMTRLAIERVEKVPGKLNLALLDMLGVELDGPVAARTGLRMRLSGRATEPLDIPAGTEVGTLRTAAQPSMVFTVQEDFTILPLRPVAYVIQRERELREIGVADGVAHPLGGEQLPFSRPPKVDDALYLGFEHSLRRLVMSVAIEASLARGAGVEPDDPPLRWECSQGGGRWADVDVLRDLTGGFNYGSGTVDLQCPPTSSTESVAGRRGLQWLRCRVAETARVSGQPAGYTQPPEIYEITAAPTGVLLPAEHSLLETAEPLGISDGSPGQTFSTRFHPVLAPAADETLEVQIPAGDWEAWELRDGFAHSGDADPHFTLDRVHGVIRLGPALQGASGAIVQHGAVPPKGAALRMSRYRHGGGREGNVDAGLLTTLRSAIPGVASVSNHQPARGGVDPQSVESLRERAPWRLRTQQRAVTAADYEVLAAESTPRVARALHVPDDEPGVTLRLLPRVDPADRPMSIEDLTPDEDLVNEVRHYLQARSFVGVGGTRLRVLPMRFRAVSVIADLEASPRADVQRIEHAVSRALYTYLNPLIGGTPSGSGAGWPAGRSLNQGELYSVVHAVEGIHFVKILRLYEMNLHTREASGTSAGRRLVIEPDEVIASGEHRIRVLRRER